MVLVVHVFIWYPLTLPTPNLASFLLSPLGYSERGLTSFFAQFVKAFRPSEQTLPFLWQKMAALRTYGIVSRPSQ